MNRLNGETSPYLLQHAANPVDWYPWGDGAFAAAAANDKPILLSVGYSACHWCHVMAHESFESDDIAAVMNNLFINIKVDREERPDVDAIYMDAVQALTGRGGWPMTVFLLPDGRPFYGGTYFPPTDRHGMPGFPKLLQAVASAYRDRRVELVDQAATLTAALGEQAWGTAPAAGGDDAGVELESSRERARSGVLRAFDSINGGFGGAPKFPHAMALDAALRLGEEEVVRLSLDRMARGGIYDQVGGGFHRYTVDGIWLVPHFEKMLYDNALLSRLYADAWLVFGDELYRRIALETCDYVVREMCTADGGLASSQDADSEGEEGKFFVWSLDELGGIAPDLIDAFGVTSRGNFEGHNILTRRRELTHEEAAQRAALYDHRERRVHPGRDDKVIVSWSSLMAGSLAYCGAVFARPDLIAAAVAATGMIATLMRRADGRLLRAAKDGAAGSIPAFAEDYGAFAAALVDVYEATFERRAIDLARQIYIDAERLFGDPEGRGWFMTGNDQERLIARPKDTIDNAVPSACSLLTRAGLRLAAHFGDDTLAARPRAWVTAMSEGIARQPLGFGHLFGAADWVVRGPVEVALIGGDPALSEVVWSAYAPNRVLAGTSAGGDPPADLPLLAGKTGPGAYVCRDYVCDRPTQSAIELAALLAGDAGWR